MKDWMQRKVVKLRSSGYYCLEDIATLKSQVRSQLCRAGLPVRCEKLSSAEK